MKSHFFLSLLILITGNFYGPSAFSAASVRNLVIIGDSITEGYGVAKDSAYPALLQKLIDQDKKNWHVTNAGISGATSASGLSRLKWHLKSKPNLVILALGANDGLRGFKPPEIYKNLNEAIKFSLSQKTEIILIGMQMPPNYGTQYTKEFKETFVKVAKDNKIKFIPFLLDGVAGNAALNLPDGIHPNLKGHEIIAQNIYKQIKDWL